MKDCHVLHASRYSEVCTWLCPSSTGCYLVHKCLIAIRSSAIVELRNNTRCDGWLIVIREGVRRTAYYGLRSKIPFCITICIACCLYFKAARSSMTGCGIRKDAGIYSPVAFWPVTWCGLVSWWHRFSWGVWDEVCSSKGRCFKRENANKTRKTNE